MLMKSPRKILAIKLRSLGDTVLMTAPLNELRAAYPEAEIHVVVSAAWAPLLEAHPAVDQIWLYERHREATSRAKALARLAIHLRKEKFDAVVNFHASPSSSALAYATGARDRSIHFHGHKDKNRYSTVTIPGKGMLKPIIERDMDAIRAFGVHVPAGRLPRLQLQLSEKTQAAERITQLNLPGPVLALGLGASRPTKSWPIDRFAALAISWCQQTQGGVLALTGPNESSLAHDFMRKVDDLLGLSIPQAPERAVIRTKITTESGLALRQLAAVIDQSAVFCGNDSGPKHIAVAVDTPTVTLFGPEDPYEWHPYPQEMHPIFYVKDLPCRKDADPGMPPWCGLNACVEEHHKCMREIGVEQVLQQCLQQLQKRSKP